VNDDDQAWATEVHAAWVPPRRTLQDPPATVIPAAGEPPPGLSRRQRRRWKAAERERLDLAKRQDRRDVMAKDQTSRVPALLLVLGVILALLVIRAVFGGEDQTAGPGAPADQGAPPSAVLAAPPAPPTAPQVQQTPVQAVLLWYPKVCGSSPEDPQASRYARASALMTPDAFTQVAATYPQPVEWTCTGITARQVGSSGPTAVVAYDATRVLTTGEKPPVHEVRTVQLTAGSWLIGPVTGAG
jgi:hypothetical protein